MTKPTNTNGGPPYDVPVLSSVTVKAMRDLASRPREFTPWRSAFCPQYVAKAFGVTYDVARDVVCNLIYHDPDWENPFEEEQHIFMANKKDYGL